jgi:hypothetical protein
MEERSSENAKAAKAQVSTEIATQRRTIGRVCCLGGALLAVSTVLVWVNHPKIVRSPSHPNQYQLVETSQSIGLVTWLAGPITLVLAVAVLWIARLLLRGVVRASWVALLLGLGGLVVSSVECIHLLLERKSYLEHATLLTTPHPPLADAVGTGVWLSIGASVIVVAAAWTYLWRARQYWRPPPRA